MSEPNVPLRRLLTQGIRDMLEDSSGRKIGIMDGPADVSGDTSDLPYAVIYDGRDTTYMGTLLHPQADGRFRYIIHSFGLRGDQAEWMSDQVVEAMLGRDDNGAYLHDITVDNLVVMDREAGESSGQAERKGKIYSVVDTFIVSVTTS